MGNLIYRRKKHVIIVNEKCNKVIQPYAESHEIVQFCDFCGCESVCPEAGVGQNAYANKPISRSNTYGSCEIARENEKKSRRRWGSTVARPIPENVRPQKEVERRYAHT